MSVRRLRVLMIAPNCDGSDVGESWSAHQWVAGIAGRADVTLLTYNRRDREPAVDRFARLAAAGGPRVEVVQWPDAPFVGRFERFNAAAKPGYPLFYVRARRWVRCAMRLGRVWDIAHQVTPIAMRYPSPASGLGVPLVLGPLAGSVPTVPSFASEVGSGAWYAKLRGLDGFRFRRDPLLRGTYAGAAAVLGVAPYVGEVLSPVGLRRFETEAETGVLGLPESPRRVQPDPGALRLLFVGRVVRTKGVRDAVRALAQLSDLPGVTLDVVGDGDDRSACEREADVLGLGGRVVFHGKVPRAEVDGFYRGADVFFFPSFREPSGNVVFESMSHGLPVIASTLGGPGHVVDGSCGVRVEPTDPAAYASGLASAVRGLASDPRRVVSLGCGARARIARLALWPEKIDRMFGLYRSVLGAGSVSGAGGTA